MKEFVPLTDDFPLESLARPGVLVPYRFGFVCHHALAEEDAWRPARGDARARPVAVARRVAASANTADLRHADPVTA